MASVLREPGPEGTGIAEGVLADCTGSCRYNLVEGRCARVSAQFDRTGSAAADLTSRKSRHSMLQRQLPDKERSCTPLSVPRKAFTSGTGRSGSESTSRWLRHTESQGCEERESRTVPLQAADGIESNITAITYAHLASQCRCHGEAPPVTLLTLALSSSLLLLCTPVLSGCSRCLLRLHRRDVAKCWVIRRNPCLKQKTLPRRQNEYSCLQ